MLVMFGVKVVVGMKLVMPYCMVVACLVAIIGHEVLLLVSIVSTCTCTVSQLLACCCRLVRIALACVSVGWMHPLTWLTCRACAV